MSPARAELRKLLTLPSMWVTALATWSAGALLGWLYAVAEAGGQPLGDDRALGPLGYAQAGFVVLGVLAAASEYQAGDQIRTTLVAMPRRLPLQAVKALTLTVVTLPLAAVTAATSTVPAGEPGRAPVAAACLTLTALLSAAVGCCLRRAETALVVLLVLYFVAGPLLRARDGSIAAWLPDTAVQDPSRGAVAAVAWTAAAVTVAAVTFVRRDA